MVERARLFEASYRTIEAVGGGRKYFVLGHLQQMVLQEKYGSLKRIEMSKLEFELLDVLFKSPPKGAPRALVFNAKPLILYLAEPSSLRTKDAILDLIRFDSHSSACLSSQKASQAQKKSQDTSETESDDGHAPTQRSELVEAHHLLDFAAELLARNLNWQNQFLKSFESAVDHNKQMLQSWKEGLTRQEQFIQKQRQFLAFQQTENAKLIEQMREIAETGAAAAAAAGCSARDRTTDSSRSASSPESKKAS